jgi:CheY-like chemotaxis protein
MDKDTLKRLLDPFFTTKGKKTGLGIPLLAQAARETEGDITVESSPENGTVVKATFALNHIDRKPLGDLVSTLMSLIGGNPEVDITFEYRKDKNSYNFSTKNIRKELNGIPLNLPEVWHLIREELREGLKKIKRKEAKMKKKVLVIDDEAIVRVSCQRVLEPEGYEVKVTSRGDEALRLMEEEKYDIVLTDLKMPDMDGLEVLKEIKRRWPDIQVIIITGYGTISTAVQAIKLGAYDYIEKPFTPEDILNVVKRAMEDR